ncbi:MAG: response regulator [Methanobacteriota archaeon]|nr:MAG: response regulator [Euryarchaeota archaeon]
MADERIKLLIVDDEEGMRTTLSDIFRKRGYEVETASKGREGVEKVKKGFVNVVLLDIKLPDMGGVEVLKEIKRESPDTEVVMITAYASLQTSVEALNEGAYGYIMKPFEVDVLANAVAGAVERQRLILENRRLREFNENIVQSLSEGILMEDENGIITFVNPRVEAMVGYPAEEIIGKRLRDFLDLEGGPEGGGRPEGAKARSESRYEALLVTKDGGSLPVMISAVPLFEKSRYTGLLSLLTDISQIKDLEKELQEKVDELEHFNRLMVGRELRMVELKNRIKELENELEALRQKA